MRVLKESLASYMTPEALGTIAHLMLRRLESDGEHNVDYAVVGAAEHWSRGWLDTLADRCEALVAQAMQGSHTRSEDQLGVGKYEERARALTTRAAVMQRIANTTTRHISEHWESAGVDGLQEQLASEMDSTGNTLFQLHYSWTNTFQ